MAAGGILLLPGWGGPDAAPWLVHWARRSGHSLVPQHDWLRPLRGDWLIQLEEAVLARPGPVVLVAHDLGCHLVAAWAACSRHAGRVRGALLVDPADLAEAATRARLPSWWPPARQRLPFPSIVLACTDAAGASASHAPALAADWGAEFIEAAGPPGPTAPGSAAADWPEGQALLQRLLAQLKTKETMP